MNYVNCLITLDLSEKFSNIFDKYISTRKYLITMNNFNAILVGNEETSKLPMEHLNAGLKEISVAVLQSIHTCKCTYAIL
jgi:hypothetical protein